ncbi:hypothetical protein Trydic_g23504 [Trypoxylus dichotomus]
MGALNLQFKILIVGGGTAGCNIAHRFSRILWKNEIIIIEPSEVLCYQSDFTFVGAGVRKLRDMIRASVQVLPTNAIWLQDKVVGICPNINTILTKKEDLVEYEFMVLALRVVSNFEKVKGLPLALENYRNVCSIYSPKYAEKTFRCLKDFVKGTAIFTAPRTTTKFLAASYNVCFIAEDYFKKHGRIARLNRTSLQ